MKIGNALTITIDGSIKQAVCNIIGKLIHCRYGRHKWEFDGARPCPFGLSGTCSQSVYKCSVCGQFDYGEKGGIGWQECKKSCKHGF